MLLSSFYLLLVSCLLGAAGSAVYSPPHYAGTSGQGINLPLTRVCRQKPHGGVLASDVSMINSRE
jgi:hypothetical protein